MRYIKPFLVTFTACVLICSIPISSCALGTLSPYDERIARFTYNNRDVDASTSPWFHVVGRYTLGNSTTDNADYEAVGHIHCRGGHVYKAFLMFIPFVGYYLVVVQDSEMHIDYNINNGTMHAFLRNSIYKKTDISVTQDYVSWYGDGYLSQQNLGLFQTVLFGYYCVFYRIQISNTSTASSRTQYSTSNYGLPTDEEEDAILGFIGNNSGTDKPFPGGSATAEILNGQKSETPTYPDGSPVPTNQAGNPVPTNEFGQPVLTLPNGMPHPLYPDGTPAEIYTTPDGEYHTVPYSIYDNAINESDVNEHFSKFNDMISDLDNLSSLMESNASDLSGHVDGTRGLVDDVLSWFPAPVIAIMVCGVIMIIAVKITGSGKS